jgi:hypothetical protein
LCRAVANILPMLTAADVLELRTLPPRTRFVTLQDAVNVLLQTWAEHADNDALPWAVGEMLTAHVTMKHDKLELSSYEPYTMMTCAVMPEYAVFETYLRAHAPAAGYVVRNDPTGRLVVRLGQAPGPEGGPMYTAAQFRRDRKQYFRSLPDGVLDNLNCVLRKWGQCGPDTAALLTDAVTAVELGVTVNATSHTLDFVRLEDCAWANPPLFRELADLCATHGPGAGFLVHCADTVVTLELPPTPL